MATEHGNLVEDFRPPPWPEDFGQCLERLKGMAGLTWRELARQLKVNVRVVWRWKAGASPGPGHLVSLFSLAAGMGLRHLLLPEAGQPRGEDQQE